MKFKLCYYKENCTHAIGNKSLSEQTVSSYGTETLQVNGTWGTFIDQVNLLVRLLGFTGYVLL